MTPGLGMREAERLGWGQGRGNKGRSEGVNGVGCAATFGSHLALQLVASGEGPPASVSPPEALRGPEQPGGRRLQGWKKMGPAPHPATAQARPGLQLRVTWAGRGGGRGGQARHRRVEGRPGPWRTLRSLQWVDGQGTLLPAVLWGPPLHVWGLRRCQQNPGTQAPPLAHGGPWGGSWPLWYQVLIFR